MKDYYYVLGVVPDASLEVIKVAYRQKAFLYHPDRNTQSDAPARFREVKEAYTVLSSPEKRKAYDEERRRNLLDDPNDVAKKMWQQYLEGVIS
jgi:curved DNA-binding protein CbpA